MNLPLSARYFAGLLLVISFIALGTLTMGAARFKGQISVIGQSLSLVPTLRPVTFIQNLEDIQQLEFCEDGTRLFTRSRTGRIAVYEVGTWRRLRQWKTDFGMFYVSRDGKRLLVRGVSRDFSRMVPDHTTYRMWDVDSGKLLSSWQSVFSRKVKRSFSFNSVSPDLTRAVIAEYEHVAKRQNQFSLQARATWIVDAANGKKLKRLPIDFTDESMIITEWQNQTLRLFGESTPIHYFRTSDWKPIRLLPETVIPYFSADEPIRAWADNGRSYPQFVQEKSEKKQFGSLVLYNAQTQSKQHIQTDFDFVFSLVPTSGSLVIHAARKHGNERRKEGEQLRYKNFIQIRTLDGQKIKAERPGHIKKMSSGREVLMIATGYEGSQSEKAATYDIFRASDGVPLCHLDRKANPLDGDWEESFWSDQEYMELSPDGKWCVMGNTNGLIRIWELPPVA